jgi:hypothetical protein
MVAAGVLICCGDFCVSHNLDRRYGRTSLFNHSQGFIHWHFISNIVAGLYCLVEFMFNNDMFTSFTPFSCICALHWIRRSLLQAKGLCSLLAAINTIVYLFFWLRVRYDIPSHRQMDQLCPIMPPPHSDYATEEPFAASSSPMDKEPSRWRDLTSIYGDASSARPYP